MKRTLTKTIRGRRLGTFGGKGGGVVGVREAHIQDGRNVKKASIKDSKGRQQISYAQVKPPKSLMMCII